MSKTLFANSEAFANIKAALAFAGLTLVGAVAMVSPQGAGGLLGLGQGSADPQPQAPAEAAPAPAPRQPVAMPEPLDPASGWGGTPDPVFGAYSEDETVSEEPQDVATPVRVQNASRAAPRNLSIGGPVKADRPGVLVPRPDGEGAVAPPPEQWQPSQPE